MTIQELLVRIVTGIQANLILLLPFILVVLRFIVMRIAGESVEEFWRSMLNVPIELCFAAIGIVLSALHDDFPGFSRRFGVHTGGVGAVMVIIISIFILISMIANRFADKLSKNFIVAMRKVQTEINNPGFKWGNDIGTAGRMFWAMRYITGIIIVWGSEVVVAYLVLRYIADSVV